MEPNTSLDARQFVRSCHDPNQRTAAHNYNAVRIAQRRSSVPILQPRQNMNRLLSSILPAAVAIPPITHEAVADMRDDRIQSPERRVEQLEKLLQSR